MNYKETGRKRAVKFWMHNVARRVEELNIQTALKTMENSEETMKTVPDNFEQMDDTTGTPKTKEGHEGTKMNTCTS